MILFNNRHVVVAMIIAPILAVASYYAVGVIIQEQPKPAAAGHAYPLLAQSNCRYSSGQCSLVNASFKSTITVRAVDGQVTLDLVSNNKLQSAQVGFVTGVAGVTDVESATDPVAMVALDSERKHWSMRLSMPTSEDTIMRVALTASDSFYYAETRMAFSRYQTSFDKNFRE